VWVGKEVLGIVLLANGVRCYLVTDECRLARHALPLGILLNPDIGKTTGAHDSLSFLSYLVLVHPGSNGNIPVQVNRHSAPGKLVVMIDSVSDMSQPLALVHKAPIVVREIKGLRKQRTESLRIVCDFGLIPSVLKGQNPSGLIRSHTSVRSSDGRREPRRLGARMTVYPSYPASQSGFQSPRPLERSSQPSGIDAQWIPEAPLPAFRTATVVVQICVPMKAKQSEHRDAPFSTSRLSILPGMVLCDPVC